MTVAERHSLHGSLRVLDELTDEDWLAAAAWVQAPQRIRGGPLWPRSRAEFVANVGEAMEKIRAWWKAGGQSWHRSREGRGSGAAIPDAPKSQQRQPQAQEQPAGEFASKADATDYFRSLRDDKAPALP